MAATCQSALVTIFSSADKTEIEGLIYLCPCLEIYV